MLISWNWATLAKNVFYIPLKPLHPLNSEKKTVKQWSEETSASFLFISFAKIMDQYWEKRAQKDAPKANGVN